MLFLPFLNKDKRKFWMWFGKTRVQYVFHRDSKVLFVTQVCWFGVGFHIQNIKNIMFGKIMIMGMMISSYEYIWFNEGG